MKVDEAIKKRRSIRGFQQKKVGLNLLKELVAAARLAPSAANIQPLRYIIIAKPNWRQIVFNTLSWAAYIAPEGTPKKGARPMAYILVLIDKKEEKFPAQRDVGAAVQNILLLATAKGIASCWLGAIKREKLALGLEISSNYAIDSVVALGYPNEKSLVEAWHDSPRYFKDARGCMHVPKRDLKDLILAIK